MRKEIQIVNCDGVVIFQTFIEFRAGFNQYLDLPCPLKELRIVEPKEKEEKIKMPKGLWKEHVRDLLREYQS